MTLPYEADGFGLRWHADLPLPGFDAATGAAAGASVEVRRVERLRERPGGRAVNRGTVHADGIRFPWGNEAVFDLTGAARIDYRPGPGWTGAMPAAFYGTLAALTLAWRGIVPLHACAVEIDGAAVLLAGPAGAGKSTTAAALVTAGARFVADDLVAVSVGDDGRPTVARGRPTLRLHPATAARLATSAARPVPGDPRGKWIVRPARRAGAVPLAVAAIVLLEGDAGAATGALRVVDHLFRRRWLAALPMRAVLRRRATALATAVPVLSFPPVTAVDAAAQDARAAELLSRIGTARRPDGVGRIAG